MQWLVSLSILVLVTEPVFARAVRVQLSCDQMRENYEDKVNGVGPLSEDEITALKANYADCAKSDFTALNPRALAERLTKYHLQQYQEAKNLLDEKKVGSPKNVLDLAARAKVPATERRALRNGYEQAGKAGCEDHDLRKSPNYPPVINQTPDNKWCYAYSLATALGMKLGVQVSAADIALTYMKYGKRYALNKDGGRNHNLDEGSFEESWKLVKEHGYCLESKMHSGENSYGPILDVYDKIDQAVRLRDSAKNRTSCPAYGHMIESISSDEQLKNLEDINDVSLALEKDSVIFHVADKACGQRPKLDDALSLNQIKPPDLNKKINEALAAGRVLPIDNSMHALAIVGTKWDPTTMTCRYLVRDSLSKDERAMSDPTAQREDDHHYWISRDQFLKGAEPDGNRLFEIK